MVDTHCHPHDYPHPKLSLDNSLNKGIVIHQMTISPVEYESILKQPVYQHNQLNLSLGLYPLEVDIKQEKLKHFLKLCPSQKFIGEIGLDYSTHDQEQQRAQEEAFQTILGTCHTLNNKVLSVHSRRAGEQILKTCSSQFNGTIILHWFSGEIPENYTWPAHLYFSINTAMLKSRNGRKLLDRLPLKKTLLESDGPYIKINEQAVESWQLTSVLESLAKRHKKSTLEIAQQIHSNYLEACSNG